MPAPAASKMKLQVWLLEHNHLAELYLRQVLERHSCLILKILDDTSFSRPLHESDCVVVIDNGTLPRPLPAYLHSIRLAMRKAGILIIDRQRSGRDILDMISRGVLGFVGYSDVKGQLIPAIQSVSRGQLWFKADAVHHRASIKAQPEQMIGLHLITVRERDVIELLQRRLSNKEISRELNISEGTVKFHLSNIFSKLGLHDRVSVTESVRITSVTKRADLHIPVHSGKRQSTFASSQLYGQKGTSTQNPRA